MLRFLLIFGALMGLFYVVFQLPPKEYPTVGNFFTRYLGFYARISGVVLAAFGYDISVTGQNISSPEYSVRIVRGCDAIEATAIFVAAVLASPVPPRPKIPGILAGILLLGVTNLIRIASLFYIGIHFPRLFDTMHADVWQTVFILLAVCFWLIWATWARRRTAPHVLA
ncbi:MAG: exosortase H [Planctomycetota bacterium]